ncbi:19882_t:CDS:2 [Gigaspora rosea]|nr:19882_t:CDS:2 [Gigaspora rosea]
MLLEESKIRENKVCEDVGDDFKLYTEEKEVLDRVGIHFKEQFRKRNFNSRNLKQEWQEQYKPKENIKEEWYNQVLSEITLEE